MSKIKTPEEELANKKEKDFRFSVKHFTNKCSHYFPAHLLPKTEKQGETWLETIDKLHRIDGVPYEHIVEIVKWAREDEFWSSNFLSLTKLRKKNKDGIKYIVVFSEKMKSEQSKSGKIASAAIQNHK